MTPSEFSSNLVLVACRSAGRETLLDALRERGWRAQALESWNEAHGPERPEAVFLDQGDRLEPLQEACRRLRSSPSTARARILVALEAASDELLDDLVKAGADDFIQAPADPALVCHRLRLGTVGGSCSEDSRLGWMLSEAAFMRRLQARVQAAERDCGHVALLSLTTRDGLEGHGRLAREVFTGLESLSAVSALTTPLEGARCSSIGEDHLLVMVPALDRMEDVVRIGDLLLAACEQISAVGVSAGPEDSTSAAELVEQARIAARRADRGTVEFFTPSMGCWAKERLAFEESLYNAVENDELRVLYQPRVDAQTRQILGMECLVRWNHPRFGIVPPDQFIPLAEQTGLIVPIGAWVLREACRQNQAWRAAGLPPIRVSVNLSPVQFRRPDLFDTVRNTLADAGLDEDGLELEVTESTLMHDPVETIATLENLKRTGVHISIDDFGTGYSSLSNLKRFPIDAVKIDRSFIDEVSSDPDDAAIATAIILMGHSMKLAVVAEGVETERQLTFLQLLRCDEIQGYLISPPVPADVAERLLRRQASEAA